MKKLFFFILLSSFGFVTSEAQIMGRIGDEEDLYRTPSGRVRSAQEVAVLRRVNEARLMNARFNPLREMSEGNLNRGRTLRREYEANMKKAKKYVAPNSSYQTEYKSLLSLPDAGIIKLLPNKPCEPVGKKAIKQCPQNFIAGNGRYFSFRLKDYVLDKWADLEILNDFFVSNGLDNQGVLVNLGDVNLDGLSLTSKGIEFLTNFAPSTKVDEINKQYMQLLNEIEVDGFRYSKALPIETSKTYALRVVAYERDVDAALTEEQKKITKDPELRRLLFDPLRDDTRQDVIAVFRVLEKSKEGTIIIWKVLQRKNAPYIETNPVS
jgi:hypothetical protein